MCVCVRARTCVSLALSTSGSLDLCLSMCLSLSTTLERANLTGRVHAWQPASQVPKDKLALFCFPYDPAHPIGLQQQVECAAGSQLFACVVLGLVSVLSFTAFAASVAANPPPCSAVFHVCADVLGVLHVLWILPSGNSACACLFFFFFFFFFCLSVRVRVYGQLVVCLSYAFAHSHTHALLTFPFAPFSIA